LLFRKLKTNHNIVMILKMVMIVIVNMVIMMMTHTMMM